MTSPSSFMPGAVEPTPAQPTRPPFLRRRWVATTIVGGGVVVLALAGVLLFTGRGFDATGTFTLYGTSPSPAGTTCAGEGGYSDIAVGTPVVVTDAAGKTLAIGKLDSAFGMTLFECRFEFSVPGVPTGEDFYGIEVSHRGVMPATEDKMREPIKLELGKK